MSGAVAAHAAYNGAGTQGLAVTNKINDTGDVMSVFWTKHDTTRQLLHGSSIVEVVSSGSSGTTNAPGSSRIFTVNNDVDVLGDLFLEMTINVKLTEAATPVSTKTQRNLMDFELDQNFQYKLIDRVEFMVGTQIWHTLTGNDIKVLTKTTKAESCSDIMSKPISSDRFIIPDADNIAVPADAAALSTPTPSGTPEAVKVVLWIPGLSADVSAPLRKFYNITENGYLMAAAPQQSVKIKVTFSSGVPTGYFQESSPTSNITTKIDEYPVRTSIRAPGTGVIDERGSIFDLPNTNNSTALFNYYPFRRVVLTHATINSFARTVAGVAQVGVSTDANYVAPVTAIAGDVPLGPHSVSVEIGRTRLFAKQIMLCKEERDQIRSVPNGLPYRIKMTQSIRADLPTGVEKTIDLDSFSLYASHLIISGDWSDANITSAELKLNSSSFSGSIPSLILRNDMAESLHLYNGRTLINSHVGSGIYVENLGLFERAPLIFPLASTAFSGSSVPLNRFDSIRLILRFNVAPVDRTLKVTTMGITVTCVGETTILYKGGAATLAMY
jgi:hypothetical protein